MIDCTYDVYFDVCGRNEYDIRRDYLNILIDHIKLAWVSR